MRQFLYKTLFVFSLGLILPQIVFAAEMFFEQEKVPGFEDQFKMDIFLKTEEPLNAIEGKINFPIDLLELQNIEDGNSVINLWLERPAVNKTGEIIFSGITPGGYMGDKGLIFSMIFLVKQEGVGTLDIHDTRVLRNDGTGSEATLTIASFDIAVFKGAPAEIPAIPKMRDRELPEIFTPEIARDEFVSDNKWFVVFVTQDKASGIDRYEIKESRQRILSIFKRWIPAESPYVLEDQELRSYVLVKAVDKTGNERVVKIAPKNPLAWYVNYDNWIMIIAGFLIVAFAARKSWKKQLA